MFDPTRPVLVASGDTTVDAYLKAAQDTRRFQRSLEDAERDLTAAQRADDKHSGFNGTAERRQRCEASHATTAVESRAAWTREKDAESLAAAEGDRAKLALVHAEIETMWSEFYSQRPTGWPETPPARIARH
ncbi:hypothetical protein AB0C10_16285 [Microbispora amethystogenes]|uniref:hypothetical protein n=1 Tax=Microbispora amethystogenes TaxID=1427754 RepID=UPI0033DA82AB